MLDRRKQLARRSLDKRLANIRDIRNSFSARQGWIRMIRDALGMSGSDLSRRMGVTKQRLSKLEEAERNGAATLASMRKAAEALDCQFIYAFLPYEPLEDMVACRARNVAVTNLKRVDQTMALEGQSSPDADRERRIEEYIQDHLSEADLWKDE